MGRGFVCEPDLIVELYVQISQRVGDGGAILIQVAEVGGVDGIARQQTGWQWRDTGGVKLQGGSVWSRQGAEFIGTIAKMFDYFEGAPALV
jgi:hypothetical protein